MKAALYARFSSDLQRATSIEDQYRNCRKRAEAEGWDIVAKFADQAMTGSDASRPEYQAMLNSAMRNDFEVLIVDDLSRLTRDSVEAERIIRRLEFNGIRIISTSDGYDSTSKARKVHRGFKGLMNEIFIDDLRERVHRGLSGVAMKHYWTGGRAFGYRLRPILDPVEKDQYGQPARIATKLEIDEVQAEIVKEIFTSYADGMSCLGIARELNNRGVPHPGLAWKKKKAPMPGLDGIGGSRDYQQSLVHGICALERVAVRSQSRTRRRSRGERDRVRSGSRIRMRTSASSATSCSRRRGLGRAGLRTMMSD
jgi:site-specific DNA recombinase